MPGFGAPVGLYRPCLPPGWSEFQQPSFRETGGDLEVYRQRLSDEVARYGRVALAGHSMGAVVAVLTALDRPDVVERLLLVSPAGLPLERPLHRIVATLADQTAHGLYSWPVIRQAGLGVAANPVAARRLAQTIRGLDMSADLVRLRAFSIRATVVACAGDELTTPGHCRRIADLAGAAYREVVAPGGHVWVLRTPELLAAELDG